MGSEAVSLCTRLFTNKRTVDKHLVNSGEFSMTMVYLSGFPDRIEEDIVW